MILYPSIILTLCNLWVHHIIIYFILMFGYHVPFHSINITRKGINYVAFSVRPKEGKGHISRLIYRRSEYQAVLFIFSQILTEYVAIETEGVCVCVCVSVCVSVCLCVCVISTAHTDWSILMKLSTNDL